MYVIEDWEYGVLFSPFTNYIKRRFNLLSMKWVVNILILRVISFLKKVPILRMEYTWKQIKSRPIYTMK